MSFYGGPGRPFTRAEGLMESLKSYRIRDQLKDLARESDSPNSYLADNGVLVLDAGELDDMSREWADRYGEEYMENWVPTREMDPEDREFFRKELLPEVAGEYARKEDDYFLVVNRDDRNQKSDLREKAENLALYGTMIASGIGALYFGGKALQDDPHACDMDFAEELDGTDDVNWKEIEHEIEVEEKKATDDFMSFLERAQKEETAIGNYSESMNLEPQINMAVHCYDRITMSHIVDRDGDGLIDPMEVRMGSSLMDWDTDGDSIPDGVETFGIRRNGKEAVMLSDMGADVDHKDLFVQMMGKDLDPAAKKKAVEIWGTAPVTNPDGEQGIDLHIDDDTEGYSLGGENPDPSQFAGGDGELSVEEIDTSGSPRYGVFRFGFVDSLDVEDGVSGEALGANFTITERSSGNPKWQTGLFNHELGHTVLGKIDEENRYPGEGIKSLTHTRFPGHVMFPFMDRDDPNIYFHPETWSQVQRDGIATPPGLEHSKWEVAYRDDR